ncbi:glutathione S-transferase T3-like [Eutrema salsugineum]|uniref:glutathione S-transferase T3-like n=1 Tax=Eutrema salsugineum TaxID=72664 RepID=UPI000CED7622|nr:glutathione S-transferase T3-like [Eutrema salsugineum]
MDPFSQPANFVDLLNSQQEPTLTDGFPSIDPLPVFSTQWSPCATVGDTPGHRGDRRTWTPKEDVLLISAWLNTSKDPVVGNEQKSGAFWQNIAIYFAEHMNPTDGVPRESGKCKQRWHKLNDPVCKFCGAFETATREKTSGMNDNDVLKMAHQIYYQDHKKKFNVEHAWRELRYDQKWSELSTAKTDGPSKKRRIEDLPFSPNEEMPENRCVDQVQPTNRPIGIKAAKAKNKKTLGEGKTLCEFEGMWVIREKEMAIQERMSKIALLDTLMARKEPLADFEENMKKKLVQELFSD